MHILRRLLSNSGFSVGERLTSGLPGHSPPYKAVQRNPLVVQCSGVCIAMQGIPVQSLGDWDPTHRGATELAHPETGVPK